MTAQESSTLDAVVENRHDRRPNRMRSYDRHRMPGPWEATTEWQLPPPGGDVDELAPADR